MNELSIYKVFSFGFGFVCLCFVFLFFGKICKFSLVVKIWPPPEQMFSIKFWGFLRFTFLDFELDLSPKFSPLASWNSFLWYHSLQLEDFWLTCKWKQWWRESHQLSELYRTILVYIGNRDDDVDKEWTHLIHGIVQSQKSTNLHETCKVKRNILWTTLFFYEQSY